MTLQEALAQSQTAKKHVDGETPGTYVVSKANFSAGYYRAFLADDYTRQYPWERTSTYVWPDAIPRIASYAGEGGWEPA